MGWINRSWKGKLVRTLDPNEFVNPNNTGVVIRDNSPKRPMHVHRYVDILWQNGTVEEEIHTSDLEMVDEK